MSTNLTTAEQLSSLASAIKAYTDAKQQETIAIVIDAIQAAGSSAATETTEPEETYTATGLSISLNPKVVSVQQGEITTSTVAVTSTNNGTYTLVLSDAPEWATLNDNTITIAPPSSTTLGTYRLTVCATGANGGETATAELPCTVTAKAADVI